MQYKNTISALFVGCVLLGACSEKKQANWENIIPMPQEIIQSDQENFILNKKTSIRVASTDEKMQTNAKYLSAEVEKLLGINLTVQNDTAENSSQIVLELGYLSSNNEAYSLSVLPKKIVIKGASPAGVFYGMQTLLKSMYSLSGEKQVAIPAVEILDYPRFAYRGMMLDVARHFSTVEEVKRIIDLLAMHNLNTLHFHLTDDQGWRIEIKKYPRLTEVGAWRNQTVVGRYLGGTDYPTDSTRHGGFYTQEDIKDMVDYAAQRNISIIPEIDLPGHMQALLASYPEMGCTGGPYDVCDRWGVIYEVLCVGNEQALEMFKDIFDEIIPLFKSPYIHIGGDECVKKRWEVCAKCQNKIKQLGLKGDAKYSKEYYLQSYFMGEIASYLRSKGKSVIGWDEVLEGKVIPESTVMSWRGVSGGIEAAKMKHAVIMTPTTHLYLDYSQTLDSQNEEIPVGGYINVETVYNYEPIPTQLNADEQKYIMGVQGNVWTEYMPKERNRHYQILPRLAALSEVAWTEPIHKNYQSFLGRLPVYMATYDRLGYNYAKHLYNVAINDEIDTVAHHLKVVLTTIGNHPIYYTLDGSEPTTASTLFCDSIIIDKSTQLRSAALHNGILSPITQFNVSWNKATFKPVTLISELSRMHQYKGAPSLVDGIVGSNRVDDGRWLAFQQGFELVIDLQQETSVSSLTLHNLTHKSDCIADPEKIVVWSSVDGKKYTQIAEKKITMNHTDKVTHSVHEITLQPTSARYIKVAAYAALQPKESPGYGFKYWLFVSELEIK